MSAGFVSAKSPYAPEFATTLYPVLRRSSSSLLPVLRLRCSMSTRKKSSVRGSMRTSPRKSKRPQRLLHAGRPQPPRSQHARARLVGNDRGGEIRPRIPQRPLGLDRSNDDVPQRLCVRAGDFHARREGRPVRLDLGEECELRPRCLIEEQLRRFGDGYRAGAAASAGSISTGSSSAGMTWSNQRLSSEKTVGYIEAKSR